MFNMNNNMLGNVNLNMNMNINPIGMNNQLIPNLAIDDSAMRIKAIIEPYEKKIMELENLIRQKDFEIILLKEKIKDISNNQVMMNIQNNMNLMNPMMLNNNNENFINNFNFNISNNDNNMNLYSLDNDSNNNDKSLNNWIINFNYKDKNYAETCNINETVETISKIFCDKIGIKYSAHKFIFNSLILPKEIKIVQSGLLNNSKILVIEKERVKCDDEFYYYADKECQDSCECEVKYNVIFKDARGKLKGICLGKQHSIEALIMKYLRKSSMFRGRTFNHLSQSGAYKVCCNLSYSLDWRIDGKKKLIDIFEKNPNPTIYIHDFYF